ncbi:MAG: hypothetical protein HKN24_08590 [Acidimicrobiales bacterium]|nr:hypothetical protein [Acidimicrobiales bacterium]
MTAAAITSNRQEPDRPAMIVVALATLGGLVLRIHLTTRMQSPFMFYDEMTGPAIARQIGGVHIQTFGAASNPLYGALLTPGVLAGVGPGGFYDFALIVNAGLAASLTPLLYVLSTRVLNTGPMTGAVGAVAGGLSAASVGFTSMMVPEALATATIPVAILAFHCYARHPDALKNQAVLAGATTAAFATHQRLLVVVLAAMLSVALLAVQRQVSKAAALRTLALVVSGYLVVALTTAALHERIYVPGSPDSGGPSEIVARAWESPALVLRSLIGTSFYLSASTAGLAVVGIVALVCLSRPSRPTSAVHRFVVLTLAGSVALSALFVSGVMATSGFRVDAYTYGRYVEHLAPVLIVYACAGWGSRQVRVAGLGIGLLLVAGGGLFAALVYSDAFWTGPIAQQNHIGLHWVRLTEGVLDIPALTVYFAAPVVLALAMSVSDRLRVPVFALSAALMVVSGTVFVTKWSSKASENVVAVAEFGQQLDALGGDFSIRVPVSVVSPITAQQLEFWAPEVDLVPFFGGEPPLTDAVLMTANSPPPVGAVELMTAERGDLVLWGLP